MPEILLYLGVIAAAIGGLSIVAYIVRKKHHGEVLVCPIGSDCNAVVQSEFSAFFGIPLEWLGGAYYLLILIGYLFGWMFPSLQLGPILFPLTFGAFLFSGYLTFIQAFSLKQWCTWCLGSAGLSTTIFLLASFVVDFSVIVNFVVQIKPIITSLHLLGFALGLGAATIGDIFFFKFLKDLRISERESATLRTVSQAIWFGLGILIISGVALVLTDPTTYLTSSKFLAKMVVVAVIAVNGAFLNLYITPLLVRISFGDKHEHSPGELHHERSLAYGGGAISLVSWYAAFVLGLTKQLPFSLWMALVIYFIILVIAIAISQVVESKIAEKGHNKPPKSELDISP